MVLKLLSDNKNEDKEVNNFIYKTLMKLNSEQAMFYLFQLFQILGSNLSKLIELFLIDYSKKSPLFSHNLIWQCKLEENANQEDDQYFINHTKKRETCKQLSIKTFEKFSLFEKVLFEELDSFLTNITNISSAMRPSMTTDEKISTISRCVEQIKVPAIAYLPTNPFLQVVEIVKGSGRAMQSAAKCPFLLSFICRPFEGVDKLVLSKNQTISFTKFISGVSDKIETDVQIRNFTTNFGLIPSSIQSIKKEHENLSTIENEKSIFGKFFSNQTVGLKNDAKSIENSKIVIKDSNLKNFDVISKITMSKISVNSTKNGANTDLNMSNMSVDKMTNSTLKSSRVNTNFSSETKKISCIFKTKDDIRQDFLTLQFITLLKQAFKMQKADLFLAPYKVFSNRTGEV